jgi:hypothetical protein
MNAAALKAMIPLLAVTGMAVNGSVLAQDDETLPESATERAVEGVSSAYDALARMLNQGSDEAVQRVQGDIENLGDWDYRIVDFANAPAEELEAELNALGDERWEAYWIESRPEGLRVFLKRSAVSYLSRLPLSTLLRLLAGGAQ